MLAALGDIAVGMFGKFTADALVGVVFSLKATSVSDDVHIGKIERETESCNNRIREVQTDLLRLRITHLYNSNTPILSCVVERNVYNALWHRL